MMGTASAVTTAPGTMAAGFRGTHPFALTKLESSSQRLDGQKGGEGRREGERGRGNAAGGGESSRFSRSAQTKTDSPRLCTMNKEEGGETFYWRNAGFSHSRPPPLYIETHARVTPPPQCMSGRYAIF